MIRNSIIHRKTFRLFFQSVLVLIFSTTNLIGNFHPQFSSAAFFNNPRRIVRCCSKELFPPHQSKLSTTQSQSQESIPGFFNQCHSMNGDERGTTDNTENMNVHRGKKVEDESLNHFQYMDTSISRILNKSPEEIIAESCANNGDNDDDNVTTQALPTSFFHQETAGFDWSALHSYIIENDEDTNIIEYHKGKEVLSMNFLVILASQCEKQLFDDPSLDRDIHTKNAVSLSLPIKGLITLSSNNTMQHHNENNNASIVVATLLSLNMLESSIRVLVQKQHGRAPLLKDMIEMIDEQTQKNGSGTQIPSLLSPILRSLLLPNVGINLRNLLWHGFVSSIHRRWLALCIVLTISMDQLSGTDIDTSQKDKMNDSNIDAETSSSLNRMRQYDNLSRNLDFGQSIMLSTNKMEQLKTQLLQSEFIPPTHKYLLYIALDSSSIQKYPVTSGAVIGLLIEHGLRLWWCDVNDMDEKVAKPGAYYVTLDGHSQRDKHDVVLLSYLSNESKNKLVHELGGQAMALLTDLFASPPGGGPNIRASIAHGLYNQYLYQELDHMATSSKEGGDNLSNYQPTAIHDMVYALLFVLQIIASKKMKMEGSSQTDELISSYRPIFSYSAMMIRGIENTMNNMKILQGLIKSEEQIMNAIDSIPDVKQREVTNALMSLDNNRVVMNLEMKKHILNTFGYNPTNSWSTEDTFRETTSNMIASGCGASILLLNEVADAVDSYTKDVRKAISECNAGSDTTCSTRRRKQIQRLFSMAGITCTFYNVCVLCALLHIQNKIPKSDSSTENQELSDGTLLHAVKRSRMVASTFSTSKNSDRAIKAVSDYLVGKSIKIILKVNKL
jgi:hypothetical protein